MKLRVDPRREEGSVLLVRRLAAVDAEAAAERVGHLEHGPKPSHVPTMGFPGRTIGTTIPVVEVATDEFASPGLPTSRASLQAPIVIVTKSIAKR